MFSGVCTYKNDPTQQVGQFIAFEFHGFPSYRKVRALFHAQLTRQPLAVAEAEVGSKMKSLIVHSFSEFKSRSDFDAFVKEM